MSEHEISLSWSRGDDEFAYERYHREHDVRFGGGLVVRASAAPEYYGRAEHPNPEEALVFAIASCHMLTFLAIAAKRKLVVECYEDRAVGTLARDADGKLAVTQVRLRPHVTWAGSEPSAETIQRLHESSHRECFIARSVRTHIVVEPA